MICKLTRGMCFLLLYWKILIPIAQSLCLYDKMVCQSDNDIMELIVNLNLNDWNVYECGQYEVEKNIGSL